MTDKDLAEFLALGIKRRCPKIKDFYNDAFIEYTLLKEITEAKAQFPSNDNRQRELFEQSET